MFSCITPLLFVLAVQAAPVVRDIPEGITETVINDEHPAFIARVQHIMELVALVWSRIKGLFSKPEGITEVKISEGHPAFDARVLHVQEWVIITVCLTKCLFQCAGKNNRGQDWRRTRGNH